MISCSSTKRLNYLVGPYQEILTNDREAKEVRLNLMEEGTMIHEDADADDGGYTYLLGSV